MARRAGVKLPPPEKGKTSEKARKQAKRELKRAEHGPVKPSPKRARASRRALEKEGHEAATPIALSRQTRKAAKKAARARAKG